MLPHGARQGFIIGACLFDLKMDKLTSTRVTCHLHVLDLEIEAVF